MCCIKPRYTKEEHRKRHTLLTKLEQQHPKKMGLCASSNVNGENNGSSGSNYKTSEGGETKDGSGGIKKSNSFSNVTEKKTENALAAAKARRLVVSDVGGFERDASFVCPKFDQTENQTTFLTKALTDNFFMFVDLEASNKTDMVGAMKMQNNKKGDELMRQGDTGDQMYVVESGNFDILVNGNVVKTSGKSDVIGELALVYQERLICFCKLKKNYQETYMFRFFDCSRLFLVCSLYVNLLCISNDLFLNLFLSLFFLSLCFSLFNHRLHVLHL